MPASRSTPRICWWCSGISIRRGRHHDIAPLPAFARSLALRPVSGRRNRLDMSDEKASRRFRELVAEANQLQGEIRLLFPMLAEARRKYMRSKNDADRCEMKRIQNIATELSERHSALGEEMRRASGLPEDMLAEIDKPDFPGEEENRLLRKDLVEHRVAVTSLVETHLAEALDNVVRLLPRGWLENEVNIPHRIDGLIGGDECLSLVKGLRPESEFPPLHRLRQMIRVASGDPENSHGSHCGKRRSSS